MDFTIELLMVALYGIVLGWLLRDRKHDIVWFFKENWEQMLVWLACVVWPLATMALFFVNLLLLWNTVLLYGLLVSMIGFVAFFIYASCSYDEKGDE